MNREPTCETTVTWTGNHGTSGHRGFGRVAER
jgi:hypothetical protein